MTESRLPPHRDRDTGPEEATVSQTIRRPFEADQARRDGFTELDATAIGERDRYLVDQRTGGLYLPLKAGWERIPGQHYFYADNTGRLHWLKRPEVGPRTLDELDEQIAEGLAAAAAAEANRITRLRASRYRPATLADVRPDAWTRGLPSLAEAAAIVARNEGELTVDHGHLLVQLPDVVLRPPGDDVRQALEVLHCAERAVVACLKAGKALPDAHVTPAGAVIR